MRDGNGGKVKGVSPLLYSGKAWREAQHERDDRRDDRGRFASQGAASKPPQVPPADAAAGSLSSMLNLLATGKERDAAKRQEVSDRVGRLRAMLAGDREGDEAIAKFLEASTEADHLYTQGDEKLTAAARMLAEYQGLEMDENREAMRAWKEKNVGTYRALLAEGRDLLKRSATVQRKTLDEAIGVHDPASVS